MYKRYFIFATEMLKRAHVSSSEKLFRYVFMMVDFYGGEEQKKTVSSSTN